MRVNCLFIVLGLLMLAGCAEDPEYNIGCDDLALQLDNYFNNLTGTFELSPGGQAAGTLLEISEPYTLQGPFFSEGLLLRNLTFRGKEKEGVILHEAVDKDTPLPYDTGTFYLFDVLVRQDIPDLSVLLDPELNLLQEVDCATYSDLVQV